MDVTGDVSAVLATIRAGVDAGRWLKRRRAPRERRSGIERRQRVLYLPPSAERRSGVDRRVAQAA
jgi:hypothetical protein